jgi:hypothetical protein
MKLASTLVNLGHTNFQTPMIQLLCLPFEAVIRKTKGVSVMKKINRAFAMFLAVALILTFAPAALIPTASAAEVDGIQIGTYSNSSVIGEFEWAITLNANKTFVFDGMDYGGEYTVNGTWSKGTATNGTFIYLETPDGPFWARLRVDGNDGTVLYFAPTATNSAYKDVPLRLSASAPASATGPVKPGMYNNADYNSHILLNSDSTFTAHINWAEGFANMSGTWSVQVSEDTDPPISITLTVTKGDPSGGPEVYWLSTGFDDIDGLYVSEGSLGLLPPHTRFQFSYLYESEMEKVTPPAPPTPAADAPSSWAVPEVNAAISAGLVPAALQKNYRSSVSRGNVAQMFINLIEKASGMPIDDFLTAKGVRINNSAFTDTSDKAVLAANALGIINGMGGSRFDPAGTLTRNQIAAIINRAASALGITTAGYSHSFTDTKNDWSDSELGWPVHAKIINGMGGSRFDPAGKLTTEQAVAITYRALKPLTDGAKTPTPPASGGGFAETVADINEGIDAKLAALTGDGKTEADLSNVMDEMYVLAQGYAADGSIKSLTREEDGIFFTYADGTPGGIVMDLPQTGNAGVQGLSAKMIAFSAPTKLAGSAGARMFAATAQTADDVIGQSNILMLSNYDYMEPYGPALSTMRGNTRGLTVTDETMYLDQLKNINQYGVVIFGHTPSWRQGGSVIFQTQDLVSTSAVGSYAADRNAGRLGLYSILSPDNVKGVSGSDGVIAASSSIDSELRYVVFAAKFFKYYLTDQGKTLPKTHVHLGFNKGLLDTELSDAFMNAGAKAVTGYSAATNAAYDGKVLAEMAKVMLVNDDKHTVTDANAAIDAASLGSNTFYHHFTTLTGTKFKYNIMQVTTRFILDAEHPNSNAQLKWWKDEEKPDTPPPAQTGLPTLVSCTEVERKLTVLMDMKTGITEVDVECVIRNDLDTPLYSVILKPIVGGVKLSDNSVSDRIVRLEPGESRTVTMGFSFDEYSKFDYPEKKERRDVSEGPNNVSVSYYILAYRLKDMGPITYMPGEKP